MKVQITANFFLDNGEVKSVEWFEIDPKLKGRIVEDGVDKPVEIILKAAKDVQDEYKKIFRKYQKEGEAFAVENILGEVSGIHFTKVAYWTLKAEEVKEEADEPTNNTTIL